MRTPLSGLGGDQNIHYHACAEGMAGDLLLVWSQIESDELQTLQTYLGQNWLTQWQI